MPPRSTSRTPALVPAGLAAALLLAGCGGSGDSDEPAQARPAGAGSTAGSTSGADSGVDYEGTLREPDATPRPGAEDKKVVVISAGQASISSSVPVAAAEEAAKALGWQVDVYDAQLNSANSPGLVRQAIASGADGIIVQAIDCPDAKGAFQEANAAGIEIVGIYSFDCDDPIFEANDPPLFTGQINYGEEAAKDLGEFTEKYGADQAKAMIAATGGQAKVVFFNSPDVTVLNYTGRGFKEEIEACAECEIVAEVEFQGSELGPNLQQKVTSALLQHPEANAVKSPYTSATLLGVAPAVVQSGRARDLYVMGGEGFAPELDLLRAGQGVTAVNIAPSDWTGWAAVDTMNSLFTDQPIADSGLGWQLVDADNNLPPAGPFVPDVDFKAAYKKAWGI